MVEIIIMDWFTPVSAVYIALIIFVIALIIFQCYRIRYRKVYEFRHYLLFNDIEKYKKLPSKDEMVDKFWINPLDKFYED